MHEAEAHEWPAQRLCLLHTPAHVTHAGPPAASHHIPRISVHSQFSSCVPLYSSLQELRLWVQRALKRGLIPAACGCATWTSKQQHCWKRAEQSGLSLSLNMCSSNVTWPETHGTICVRRMQLVQDALRSTGSIVLCKVSNTI